MTRRQKRRPDKRRKLTGPLHDNIRNLREARGLSQFQLADKLGIEKSNVSHWETGFSRPDHDMLPALATALKTTIDALFRERKRAA